MRTYSFQATLEEDEDGRWSAWLSSYPACGAWGDTKSEALEALADMTAVYLEVMADAGDPVYADSVEPDDERPEEQRNLVDLVGNVPSGTPPIKASVSDASIKIPVAA